MLLKNILPGTQLKKKLFPPPVMVGMCFLVITVPAVIVLTLFRGHPLFSREECVRKKMHQLNSHTTV